MSRSTLTVVKNIWQAVYIFLSRSELAAYTHISVISFSQQSTSGNFNFFTFVVTNSLVLVCDRCLCYSTEMHSHAGCFSLTELNRPKHLSVLALIQ